LGWSKWKPLVDEELEKVEPAPGVYKIKASEDICRLHGKSPLLYVGESHKGSVYSELSYLQDIKNNKTYKKHELRKSIKKFLKQKRFDSDKIQFRYKYCPEAQKEETRLLKKYEDKHWELPPFNHKR